MTESQEEIIGRHIVRYGTPADQKYLVGVFLDTYDQIVINANMMARISRALASFIMQRTRYKPFFIDPQTHAFQHDIVHLESSSVNSKGEIKKSFQNLLEWYGEPFSTAVSKERRFVVPEDFQDDKLRNDVCKRIINFQENILAGQADNSDVSKYYKFLQKKKLVGDINVKPSVIVAPYFCMQGNTFNKWLGINIECAKISKAITSEKGLPLAVQIVIDQEVLFDPAQIDGITQEYSKIKPDVFLVWVDNFSEQKSSEGALEKFASLVKKLSETSPVINLYGGYFSVLLIHTGILRGAVHSLEYGEERAVIPVGGGIPVAKYYLPALHSRLTFRTALRAVRALGGMESVDAFYERICACQQCKKVITKNPNEDFAAYGNTKVIRGRQYPLPQTKDNTVRHYMWSKANEYKEGLNIEQTIQQLRETANKLATVIGVENSEHCKIWADVLSKVIGNVT